MAKRGLTRCAVDGCSKHVSFKDPSSDKCLTHTNEECRARSATKRVWEEVITNNPNMR